MPGLAEPLRGVVDGGEDGVAGKGEDGRIGVQRPEPAEREVRQPQAQRRQDEFQGDDQADKHGDDAPQDGDHQERANDGIVIDELFQRPLFQKPLFQKLSIAVGGQSLGVACGCGGTGCHNRPLEEG